MRGRALREVEEVLGREEILAQAVAYAYPLMEIVLAAEAQTWQISVLIYIREAGKPLRTAGGNEVTVKLSKALAGLDKPIETRTTGFNGMVIFDGALTDGFYVLVATHVATGTQVKGTIRCPAVGVWGYENPPAGQAPWYTPTEEEF